MRKKIYEPYSSRYFLLQGTYVYTNTKGEPLRKTQPVILKQKFNERGGSVICRFDPTCTDPTWPLNKRVNWGDTGVVESFPVWSDYAVGAQHSLEELRGKVVYLGSFRSWTEEHELWECWGEWRDSRLEEIDYVKGLVKTAIKEGLFTPKEQSNESLKRTSMETLNGTAVVGDTILFADEDKQLITATILSFSEQSVMLKCSDKSFRKYIWTSEKYFYKIK